MLYKTINKTLPSKPDSAKRICWGIWLSALLCWIHACSECECSAHEESKAPSKATRFTYGWTSFGSVLDAFVSFIVRGSLSLLLCMNSTRRHSYYEQMKRENVVRRETRLGGSTIRTYVLSVEIRASATSYRFYFFAPFSAQPSIIFDDTMAIISEYFRFSDYSECFGDETWFKILSLWLGRKKSVGKAANGAVAVVAHFQLISCEMAPW